MNALSRYLLNTAQAKTGLSSSVVIGYLAQAALGVATVVLLLVAVFFVFSDYFGAESGATRTPIPAQGGQHSGDCGQRVMVG
jgi:hypothetical protein